MLVILYYPEPVQLKQSTEIAEIIVTLDMSSPRNDDRTFFIKYQINMEIQEKINSIKSQLEEVSGSLNNLLELDKIVDDLSEEINFTETETIHMKACDQARHISLLQLVNEHANLIQLLTEQNLILRNKLNDQYKACGKRN